MRTIAIDLDDTLNNFEETLQTTTFQHDESYGFSAPVFADYLARLRQHRPGDDELLSTEYSFFKYQIHQQCYERAAARADGIEFVRGLKQDGWRIVICTYRDLRRAQDCTRKWLGDNGIPFDHLFMAGNKIVFCRAWGIEYLVDDDPFNIIQGEKYGVKVFYPALARLNALPPNGARAFHSYAEILPWITG
ncbi:MAG: hypothetical protein ABI273_11990 [Lacunisphaera sp.]